MRKSAHLKNSKSDVHLEMGDAKDLNVPRLRFRLRFAN